jgi:Xaa-Pro aminopeptidase
MLEEWCADAYCAAKGPVFAEWEADFGRTFVLGNDATKKKIRDDLEPVWYTVKSRFDKKPDMTGEELYSIACAEAKNAGWEFGNIHSGHLVGDFPHERIPNDKISFYITEGNKNCKRPLVVVASETRTDSDRLIQP